MDKMKILCIAPHQELLDTIMMVAASKPDLYVQAHVGDLDDALAIADVMNYDVIVSRGGTAQLLRQSVNMPVVEIGISVYDVLRVIRLAQQTQRPFAIIGFASITNVAHLICNILQYDIPIAEISSSQEAIPAINRLTRQGIDLFLGDTVSVSMAGKLGKSGMLITSGPESVSAAFNEAQYLYECCRLTQRNDTMFRDALSALETSIVLFNSRGTMMYANHAPLGIAFSSFIEVIGKCLPKLKESKTLNVVKRLGNVRMVIYGSSFQGSQSAEYYMFRTSATYISHERPNSAIVQYNYDDISEAASYAYLFSPEMLMTIQQKLSANTKPAVFIYGEQGTQRTNLAKYIHLCYLSSAATFTEINCTQLSEKEWINCIESENSPLYTSNGTLFFRDIHKLAPSMAARMETFINDAAILSRVHLIFSSSSNIDEFNKSNNMAGSLLFNLPTIPVYVKPIRENPEIIHSICGVSLGRNNILQSKQIIGFTQDALELMEQFDWPGNTLQIESVMQQLVTICTGSYIEAQDVRSVLTCIGIRGRSESQFNLNKTLDEIELDIIGHVLAEENMNQTAAAERLGISRSTLWRKLQGGKSK